MSRRYSPLLQILLARVSCPPSVKRADVSTPKAVSNTEPEQEPEIPPIGDESKLSTFSSALPPEMLTNLFDKAEQSLNRRMGDLGRGVAESDTNLIHEAAHSIKGSSGSMFGMRISAIAAKIDANSADLDTVAQLMPGAEEAAQETIDWWRSKRQ